MRILIALALIGWASISAWGRAPNIVLIMADDLGYGGLGCYGQSKVKTPSIDRIASQGVRFTQAYAGCCMCAPSRSVLMTGLHTGHTRVRSNDPRQSLTERDVTLASLLKRSGYVSAGFGKWGLGDSGTIGEPRRHGFDDWVGFLDQTHAHFHYPDWIWKSGEQFPLSGNDQQAQRRSTYAPDVIHESALSFIRAHHDRPFFCYVATTIPHAEILAPADSMSQYVGKFPEVPYVGDHYASNATPRSAYAAMVSRLDRDVGRIVDLLKELGIENDTLVLFTSDNGPINAGGADPDFFGNAGGLRGWKFSLYEGGIRVPLIAYWPGRIAPARTSNLVTCHDDLLPTLCELASQDSPHHLDGVSIVPTLVGQGTQVKRKNFYWESPSKSGFMQALRTANFKAIRPNETASVEIYDLVADPGEKSDLAGNRPDMVKQLVEAMSQEHRNRE